MTVNRYLILNGGYTSAQYAANVCQVSCTPVHISKF